MPTKIDVNKVTWDEPINTSKVKWDDEQPTLVDKAKGVGKKVFNELAGVGETIRSVVNTVGTLPMDVGNFAGAVVDSIVQEDLSRENFDKNMARRAETTEPIRNALNPRPIYESGKRMVEGLEGSIAAPGQLIHEATYGGLSEQGYFPDGTPMPKELSVPKNVAAQIAGPASVIADVVPFVAIERGIPAMKPSTYAPKPGTPRGIGENTSPSNFQMGEGGAVESPVRPARPEPATPQLLMLPEPERIAQRRADVEAAIKTDEALLAREMTYGKEQSATQPNLFDTREQLPPNLEADYLNQARGDRLQAIKDAFESGDSELARLMAEGRTRPFDVVGDSPVQVDRPYRPDFRMVGRTPDEVIPPAREVVPPREPATLDAVWSEAGPRQITGNDTRTPRMNTWDVDSVALADEIANARGERAESIRNEQLGRFQHDDLVNAAVTPSDSLQAVGQAKPVVKGTVEQVVDMARRGEINAKEYETVYPNGARSPESPAYVIHKPSAGKNLAKIRSDLAKGKEAEHLGYPDREGVPAADLTTKAVTKDNQIISDPVEIKAEAEAGNVKWSAEGREAEVTAKAEEIVNQESPVNTDSLARKGDGIPQEVKTPQKANLEASDGITELHAGVHPKEILRGVDEGIKFARNLGSKVAPENMKTTLRKIFEFPQFAAENIPGFKPIYEQYRNWTANRESLAYDAFGEDVKPMHELHRKLTREERKDYSDIIQTQDIERRTFTADELRNGQNPLSRPVSESVIQLHTMNERVMQRLADTLINKTRELIFKGYESEPWYRELRDLVDNKVSSELYKQSQYADRNIASALADVEKSLAKHEELARRILENPGYMFRDRAYGEQHVRIFKVDEFGDMQEVYMKLHKNKLGAEWSAREIRKALNPDGTVKDPKILKKYIPKNYEEGATYKVPEVDFNKSVPEEILVYSGTQSAKSSVLNKVIENVISEGKVDKAEARNIANAVLHELTDVYKSRGFGRRFMGRKENLVEGYDTSNYVNTVTSNIGSMAGWLAKAEYAIKSMQALKDVPPEYQTYANDFIRNTLRNTNPTASKIGSTVRTALALKTLAFKTISPLINGTQNWTLGVGEYNMRIRNMGLKEDGTAQMFKAQKDVVAQSIAERSGKSHLSPYEMRAIEEFSRAGGLKAQGVRETAGLSDVGMSRGLQQVTQVGMTPFSWIESVFNREAAFLSMFRKMSENGKPYEAAFKEAADFANTVHFDMSQHNLPITFQNEVGRTALSLQRYSGMYLNWAFNRAVMQNEYRPVVRSLITVAAMGGLSALGLNQLDNIMAKYLGMSPKLFVRKYVLQQSKDAGFSDDTAEKLSMFIEKGVPTLANVDISKNVEIQAPFISAILGGNAETVGEAMSGAWAGAARNVGSGVKALGQGQYMRAAENLSPVDAFGNILKAYRMYNKGATTLSGKPIEDRDGNKLMLTESEAVMKALGVQPARVNERYDIQTIARNLDEYYRKQTEELNALRRNAETPEEKAEIRQRIKENNEERKKYNGLIPKIGRLRNNRAASRRLRRFEQSIGEGDD